MWADPQDSLGLLAAGTYEAFEVELFESLIRPGDVVVDLGANIGQHTLCFARAVGPEGQVFAFEPDPENHALLQRNAAANGYSNIVAEQKAVSDSTGTLRLFQSKTNRGDHRIYDSDDGRPSVEVPVIRLDDYFSNHHRPISFVKMDIQGAEYAALQGMHDVLQRNPDMRLFIEYWPWGLKRAGVEAQDLLSLLLDHGFGLQEVDGRKGTIQAVSPSELLEAYSPDNPSYTNLLCVRQQ
ncbi:MAG: 31-O-demethyl-FK506 methyltransferase FkbM [Actinobacteria bacterium ADurb.Bin444]|nr:MAG: 31-O-demethyl-FK506 methyltransferase FkbM [Actinobacteria bacterium ADurb.Bin444]